MYNLSEYNKSDSISHLRFYTSVLLCVNDLCLTAKTHLECGYKTHFREKPYQCNICDSCFTNSSGRKTHLKVHPEEKPKNC